MYELIKLLAKLTFRIGIEIMINELDIKLLCRSWPEEPWEGRCGVARWVTENMEESSELQRHTHLMVKEGEKVGKSLLGSSWTQRKHFFTFMTFDDTHLWIFHFSHKNISPSMHFIKTLSHWFQYLRKRLGFSAHLSIRTTHLLPHHLAGYDPGRSVI